MGLCLALAGDDRWGDAREGGGPGGGEVYRRRNWRSAARAARSRFRAIISYAQRQAVACTGDAGVLRCSNFGRLAQLASAPA